MSTWLSGTARLMLAVVLLLVSIMGAVRLLANDTALASGHEIISQQRSLPFSGLQAATGKVNLVATLGNMPAMRPMRWTLYRLDGNRQQVAASRRHSASLVVSSGHYEAVANLDGLERRREFTVLTGTRNNIVLAMD